MKTEWDYTTLADAYILRPDYSDTAINAMLAIAGISQGRVCDVGAGVAHLTLMLAHRGYDVTAVEPNDAMRGNGIARTALLPNVRWFEGTGEATGRESHAFDMVTFGSSFNVTDRPKALIETARILKPRGWFACMWNHRSLTDPIQARIEAIIKERVPGYGYGARREDQTESINASNLFGPVVHVDAAVIHTQPIAECVEAWRSHATLARQSGTSFLEIVDSIAGYLDSLQTPTVNIPYSTNIWMAQVR